MTQSARIFRINSDVVSRQMGNELVLVHLGTDRILSLNTTGARLWDLLKAGCSRDQIQAQLLQEFDVDETTLHAEIDSLISQMLSEELIGANDSN
jgi:hypothetical protein